jgi:hypothetical protein
MTTIPPFRTTMCDPVIAALFRDGCIPAPPFPSPTVYVDVGKCLTPTPRQALPWTDDWHADPLGLGIIRLTYHRLGVVL